RRIGVAAGAGGVGGWVVDRGGGIGALHLVGAGHVGRRAGASASGPGLRGVQRGGHSVGLAGGVGGGRHRAAPPRLARRAGRAGVAGMIVGRRLTPGVARPAPTPAPTTRVLGASRPVVVRLAGLFAVDSFGGGFVVQAFIAFWLAERFDASVTVIGVTFFAI